MENKIPKTSETFDDIDHPESRWVTYRGERIGPPVDHISQFSCCVAIRATPKATCYSLNIGRMYLDNLFFI